MKNRNAEPSELELKVLGNCQEGLVIGNAGDKGRGVFTTKSFAPGDFVCEYTGTLLTAAEGRDKEKIYDKKPDEYGSFVHYFVDKVTCKEMCIDSTKTEETPEVVPEPVGRLVNHTSGDANVTRRPEHIFGVPRLIFFASRFIKEGEELLYDYGDHRPSVIEGGNEFLAVAKPVARPRK